MRVLLTGGAGFLGWHTVAALLEEEPGRTVLNLDLLTYAGSRAAVADLDARFGPRHTFLQGDVRDEAAVRKAMAGMDVVVHLAAESHVDRSIADATAFVETNVLGTQVLLDEARREGVGRFVQVSTDEVYGHLPLAAGDRGVLEGRPFEEDDPLRPRSPYAASKAAGDLLALAAFQTHGLPVVVTRGCNAYGPGQYPEKLIPLAIGRALEGEPVPIYGSGAQVREWIHARDQARGIVAALVRGTPGEVYNLGSGERWTNLELVGELLEALGVSPDQVVHVADRPGHDQGYALDTRRAREELGWRPLETVVESLPALVEWYRGPGRRWWA